MYCEVVKGIKGLSLFGIPLPQKKEKSKFFNKGCDCYKVVNLT